MTSASQTTLVALTFLAALVAASPYDCSPGATVTVTLNGPSAASNALIPTTAAINEASDHMTIAVTNMYGTHLSLSLDSDAGGPSPVGNPSPGVISSASPTQYTFPTGWAGRILVGPNLNINGSKIEGSFTGPPDIDVSYVDGFSVPLTCSSEGVAVSGCNVDLFKQSACENLVEGPVCLNPARGFPEGPASAFFAACAGAAYTYPNDDEANVSNLGSNLVSCCIGTPCRAPVRQSASVSEKLAASSVLQSLSTHRLAGPASISAFRAPPSPLSAAMDRSAHANPTAPAPPYPTSSRNTIAIMNPATAVSSRALSSGESTLAGGTMTKWATSTRWATSTKWVTSTFPSSSWG